ncbi:MAG: hypothetical protein K8F35_04920 [Dokdonella sp.]|uniref:hypothetical protein n=1 Tax=Dokdonella sp. TaxID=2291710 RepID=UPI0025BED254|nr:hypothetical protein [Dokdonella sp.]MBZ0222350.1 hypothetical protein [Dokdonella sp.]
MNLDRASLEDAVRQGILAREQVERLWAFLEERNADQPSFRFTHILYYFGGLIAIGAMSLFMTLGWEQLGGWGLCFIAIAYIVLAVSLTEYLLGRKRLAIPAGITAALAVAIVPLAVYGLQEGLGWWAQGRVYRDYHVYIDWRWIMMELATLAAGAVALWRYRLPFLLMPVAVTLWYMSMDIVPFLLGDADYSWDLRRWVSLWWGLAMILVAFWIHLRSRSGKDYPFWIYLFGVLAFWGGLTSMDSNSELGKFAYFCINLGMIGVGALLSRRVFVVFGGIGAAIYLGHLARTIFKDSLLFPLALSAIGLGVIYLGILWQRNEQRIVARIRALLPEPLRAMADRS